MGCEKTLFHDRYAATIWRKATHEQFWVRNISQSSSMIAPPRNLSPGLKADRAWSWRPSQNYFLDQNKWSYISILLYVFTMWTETTLFLHIFPCASMARSLNTGSSFTPKSLFSPVYTTNSITYTAVSTRTLSLSMYIFYQYTSNVYCLINVCGKLKERHK